jgi:pimeloyl-ACP methyl ester carboxylesterase
MRTRLVAALLALSFPVFVYLVVLAVLFFAQTSLIFPVDHVAPEPPLPPGTERLTLATASGGRLAGVHLPPVHAGASPTLILGFGGNAANAGGTALMLHHLYPDADVAAFYYRGYSPSAGAPGAAALQADALLIHDALRARLHANRIVIAGFSVGSGVAAYLAAHRPVDGLILVTPFDSLAAVAADHYPWVPVRLLLRHNMEPAADLHGAAVPVAIIAGGRDSLIPAARTDALRHAIPHLVFDRTIPGAGHNDIYDNPAFPEAMHGALAAVIG